jgi:putative SOS response-associated peptidase YedK
MNEAQPFGMAEIWEYADKVTGELLRTFAMATCEPNEMNDRMPVIVAPEAYMRWLARSQISAI